MGNKWRFPSANHGDRKGISNGDTEAFKKTPYSTFAREVLQNSIDAQASDEEPVKIIFSTFSLETNNIPGITDLKKAIARCKSFWAYKSDYVDEYTRIEHTLNEKSLMCLRVSDYNTTGLIGVESNKPKRNQFLALTKGTGVSEKSGEVSGGSKGLGKNAAFLMSKIRTVFYSTKTTKDLNGNSNSNIGSIGVADFISGYVDDNTKNLNRDYTQGKGFFASDDYNNALNKILNLDPSSTNRDDETGTDIYIIGFRDASYWEKEIINSILDSFMAAIIRKQIEVEVNGTIINRETIQNIVYSDIVEKRNVSNIVSQYLLLTDVDNNVKLYDIETDYGTCTLSILPYAKEKEYLATHKCVMVRYPLMKIKDESLGASFRVSAMCMIGNDKLGKLLRSIENPQHIDWEPRRIQDNPPLRKELKNVLMQIKTKIRESVIDCLQLGDSSPLDPYGAGNFLPDNDFGESNCKKEENVNSNDNITVTTPKEVKPALNNSTQGNSNGQGLQPDVGSFDESISGNVEYPIGENNGQGDIAHGGDESGEKKAGDSVIVIRSKLEFVKYNVISTDKRNGKIKIIFKSPIDFPECYLSIGILDDTNKQDKVKIIALSCNGVPIFGVNPYEFGPFIIHQNEKIVLSVKTNVTGYFGAAVKIICVERKVK